MVDRLSRRYAVHVVTEPQWTRFPFLRMYSNCLRGIVMSSLVNRTSVRGHRCVGQLEWLRWVSESRRDR